MPGRIAILGIYHESNTFLHGRTTIVDFVKGHWLFGEDISTEYRNAHHEIGGMMEVLDSADVETLPVMYAEATPGAVIAREAFDVLFEKMMSGLEDVLPVDGCLVVPHGAAVCEGYPDMDGHWLREIRKRLGDDVPIVGTIDPHANMSQLMAASTDALVAYKTNPHIDQRQVGRESARMLLGMLGRKIHPVQQLLPLPLAISIEQQLVANEPCRSLYRYAAELAMHPDIISISIVLGFPYADVEEMGTAVIVISDNDENLALEMAGRLKTFVINRIADFNGEKINISRALATIRNSKKPVLLLDMGDNVGAGGPGDSAFLLEALERGSGHRVFICLYDPVGVRLSIERQTMGFFKLGLSNSEGTGGTGLIDVTYRWHGDGRFQEPDPRHGGQVTFDMGDVVLLNTRKGNTIMLTSRRVAPFSLRQLTDFHIHPSDFDILIAKGVNAPVAAYAPVCPTIIQVDTPGVTGADMTRFKYKNRRRPLFPFEQINPPEG